MNLDATFRPYVVVGFFVHHPDRPARSAFKSQSTGEKLDRTQEGIVMMIALRLAGLVLWGERDRLHDQSRRRWRGRRCRCRRGCAMERRRPRRRSRALLLLWTLRSLGPNLTDTVVTRQIAHAGHARPVSMGPPPVLRLHGALHDGDWRLMIGQLVRAARPAWRVSDCSRPDRGPRKRNCWSGSASRIAHIGRGRDVFCRECPGKETASRSLRTTRARVPSSRRLRRDGGAAA